MFNLKKIIFFMSLFNRLFLCILVLIAGVFLVNKISPLKKLVSAPSSNKILHIYSKIPYEQYRQSIKENIKNISRDVVVILPPQQDFD